MTAPAQTLEERLLGELNCDPECHGRCFDCPNEIGKEAAAEITRLKAALSEARETAIEEAAVIAERHYQNAVGSREARAALDILRAIRSLSRMKREA